MTDPTRSHEYRDRAESFGSHALDYDRYRPGYPPALIDELVRTSPREALDVGTGTGKAAQALAERGVSVLGVEIDPRMAEVARGHGLTVEVGSFETWDEQGRTFDLLTCAQAWHWIDPAVGVAKAARVVRPGGVVARFWNFRSLDDDVRALLLPAYAEHAAELYGSNALGRSGIARTDDDPFDASGDFSDVAEHLYDWQEVLTTEDWIGNISTHSDHATLPTERRARLLDALRSAIDAGGGRITAHSGTLLLTCSRT